MNTEPAREITNMDGDAALPRSNGELIFATPWEGRAFGIAVALNENAAYRWTEFRDELVKEIASEDLEGASPSYYEQWLASLERLLLAKGIVTAEQLDQRTQEYESGERDDDWD